MATKKQASQTAPASNNPPNMELEFTRASDFKSIYSNHVSVKLTPFDISILLSEALPNNTGTVLMVEEKARVIFSPIEAKAAHALLGKVIKAYESQFGEIEIPVGVILD